ncbi:MAG TPA: hypothetical protein VGP68_04085 [Gemmataceae bacterium]|jgi:hypothetical protein|nr:hypothetical protein [Gemmataceae bacterium]
MPTQGRGHGAHVVRGSLTPYSGIVVLSEGIWRNPNVVCGLPTTYPGNSSHLAFRLG